MIVSAGSPLPSSPAGGVEPIAFCVAAGMDGTGNTVIIFI